MMQDLSALGLRHVGYGIPTELFGPFVSAAIEKIRSGRVEPIGLGSGGVSYGVRYGILLRNPRFIGF